MICVDNGRYGGGHLPFTPGAIMNDGLLDMCYFDKPCGVAKVLQLVNQMKMSKGTFIYDEAEWCYARGTKCTIENLNFLPN